MDIDSAKEFAWYAAFWSVAALVQYTKWGGHPNPLVIFQHMVVPALAAFVAVSSFVFALFRILPAEYTVDEVKNIIEWQTAASLSVWIAWRWWRREFGKEANSPTG